ncbi:hypothetical protein ABEB36_006289 [Hypothenemus hampei]|uniref:Uncharacterized protein n=1 Tax=Hypothenemus hampei TaxID=57062 RepID=A0ABD1ET07_HYPHA
MSSLVPVVNNHKNNHKIKLFSAPRSQFYDNQDARKISRNIMKQWNNDRRRDTVSILLTLLFQPKIIYYNRKISGNVPLSLNNHLKAYPNRLFSPPPHFPLVFPFPLDKCDRKDPYHVRPQDMFKKQVK